MKFWNINFLKHFMINDQYKLDIVDRLVNCKTIKCNYVHYFMIISNYLLCPPNEVWETYCVCSVSYYYCYCYYYSSSSFFLRQKFSDTLLCDY